MNAIFCNQWGTIAMCCSCLVQASQPHFPDLFLTESVRAESGPIGIRHGPSFMI